MKLIPLLVALLVAESSYSQTETKPGRVSTEANAEAPAIKAEPSTTEPLDAQTVKGNWLDVKIGVIGAASEDILNAAMEEVRKEGYAGLVISLDTPGGALENTRNMVKTIMASPFPIVVWVGPAGSRAGSAGAFITISGHIAAMAPGTNIGAAHPIDASGKDIDNDELGRKVTNDTVAFIESIAKARNRNVDMARSFVQTSVSITDTEALENKIIDFKASNSVELLNAMNGRKITLDDKTVVKLDTKEAGLVAYEKTFRQKILEILSNPNLFYLLFMAGLIGIGYELTHPGMLFPGTVGAICLILALIATSVLPVSYGAAALIIAGVGMLVAEAFLPSFGVLGVGGFVALVLGSVFLVDPQNEAGQRISLLAIAPTAVVVGGGFLTLGYLIFRSEKSAPKSGKEALAGSVGTVIQDFIDGKGQIRVAGAIWAAQLSGLSGTENGAKKGDEVVVNSANGLNLIVAVRKPKGDV
jgi:membrane-bound serine protease (ClpP class)